MEESLSARIPHGESKGGGDMNSLWHERRLSRFGTARNGKKFDRDSLWEKSASGAENPPPYPTTPQLIPIDLPSILICTSPNVCPYAKSVTSLCTKENISVPPAESTIPPMTSAGGAYHQMSERTKKLLKRSGNESGEKERRNEEQPIRESSPRISFAAKITRMRNQGLKFREIGEQMDLTTNTVAGIYYRTGGKCKYEQDK